MSFKKGSRSRPPIVAEDFARAFAFCGFLSLLSKIAKIFLLESIVGRSVDTSLLATSDLAPSNWAGSVLDAGSLASTFGDSAS